MNATNTVSEQKPTRRQLCAHKVNGLNEAIDIEVVDAPGFGGANHDYLIKLWRPDAAASPPMQLIGVWPIHFQNGAVPEAGFNGITCEALLAIIIDRLQGFSSGELRNRETSIALTKCEEAMLWLQKRTRDRIARGVEGTYQK